METKTFAVTLGLGVAAGAAAALMLPRQSKLYKTANNAAQKLKQEVTQAVHAMKEN